MTIFELVGYIGVVALVLTFLMGYFVKNVKAYWVSFLQNFCGILFIFSGWVKAIDPLGTAFKMQQYFDQFEVVFKDTNFSFVSPVFPALNQYATAFSLFMIIFEIVLGIMLVIGAKPKFTALAFFLLVGFFTILTGFTFLTGYVPEGVNFFSFGDWGPYQAKNMKVTDCGCFGDFIKLEPRISFFKDIFLLIPSVLFLMHYQKFHQWFSVGTHKLVMIASTLLLCLYCFNNFYWNEPHIDFRPFAIGSDIRGTKLQETEAQSKVQVTGFLLKNIESGKTVELTTADYMKNFASYPKEKWETVEQIKSEPSIKPTKVSEFFLKNYDNQEVENLLLEDTANSIVIVSYKPYFSTKSVKKTVQDSVWYIDTVKAEDGTKKAVRGLASVNNREADIDEVLWEDSYLTAYKDVIKPFVDEAKKNKWNVYVITAGLNKDQAAALRVSTGIEGLYLTADDILLKTIMRSNPGIMHWKDGKIINKWHFKKLPDFSTVAGK